MNEAISLLLYIGVAILAARIFGEIFERLKLSAILGELFAGIMFGGPLFSILGLSNINDLFMDRASLRSFSQIGIILLLFIVGMEINVKALLKTGKRSMTISITEVSLALIGGFLAKLLGYNWVFLIAAIPAFLNFMLAISWEKIKERKSKKQGKDILDSGTGRRGTQIVR